MKDRLTKGAIWLTATRVLVNIIAFASTLLLARFLTPADFGLVAIATTVAAVVTSLTELSLASALVHHADPQDSHFDGAWTLNFARALMVGGVIAALAYPTALFYGDPRLVMVMFALAGTTALSGFANPKLILFSRNLVFWQEFAMGVSQKLLAFVISVVIAIVYQSYWALIVGLAAGQILALILSYVILPYRPRLRLAGTRDLLSFSVWLLFGQVVNTLNYRADNLIIGYFLGNGPLGYYTFGDNLAVLPTREATAPIAQTLFPGFARLTGDRDRLRAAYQRAQTVLCAIGLPAGCGFAMIAKPLVLATIGVKWLPAVIVIQVLASVFAIQTLSTTLQPLAMAMGETRRLFQRDIVNLAIRIPLIVIGMVSGGLIGIVYARSISGLANTAINMMLVRRLLDLPLRAQIAANGRSLVSVAAMMAALGLLQFAGLGAGHHAPVMLELAMLVACGAAIYVLSQTLLWHLAGKPGGPESEAAAMLVKILSLLRLRRQRNPDFRG